MAEPLDDDDDVDEDMHSVDKTARHIEGARRVKHDIQPGGPSQVLPKCVGKYEFTEEERAMTSDQIRKHYGRICDAAKAIKRLDICQPVYVLARPLGTVRADGTMDMNYVPITFESKEVAEQALVESSLAESEKRMYRSIDIAEIPEDTFKHLFRGTTKRQVRIDVAVRKRCNYINEKQDAHLIACGFIKLP